MQALTCRKLNVVDVVEARANEPGRAEVLTRVHSVLICGTDAHLIRVEARMAGGVVALGKGRLIRSVE